MSAAEDFTRAWALVTDDALARFDALTDEEIAAAVQEAADRQNPVPVPPRDGEEGTGRSVWGYVVPEGHEDLYRYELSLDELQ